MYKKLFVRILPNTLVRLLKAKKQELGFLHHLKKAYYYDLRRYSSNSYLPNNLTEEKLIGKIIRDYHVLEKGLTMPETRFGFGRDLVTSLVQDCLLFKQKYGDNEPQLNCAVGVIFEYEQFHIEHNFILDSSIQESISSLKSVFKYKVLIHQKQANIGDYFKYTDSPFPIFANSRCSVRHYSDQDIPISRMMEVLELARNTPSACNRQCWRSYVFEDKELIKNILTVQGGNRGFGHLTNKLIVVTSEIGVFTGIGERNEVYIDGGMYAMNLLYCLHYYKIAACILNCSNSIERDVKLRKLCGIKDSEVFICMISCGIPPNEFKIAASTRYNVQKTNKIIS